MLELFVKLASFGTAGVCIGTIFYVGYTIQVLKPNTPPWKVKLIKQYMVTCIIIAIVSAASGGVNAYFNHHKTQLAKNEYTDLKNDYLAEQERILVQNNNFTSDIEALQAQLQNQNIKLIDIQPALSVLKNGISDLNMRPLEPELPTQICANNEVDEIQG